MGPGLGMAATCLPVPGRFAAGLDFFVNGAEATGVRGAAATSGLGGGGGRDTGGVLPLSEVGGGLLRPALGGAGIGAMAVLGGVAFMAAAARLRFFFAGGLDFTLGLASNNGRFGGAVGAAMRVVARGLIFRWRWVARLAFLRRRFFSLAGFVPGGRRMMDWPGL